MFLWLLCEICIVKGGRGAYGLARVEIVEVKRNGQIWDILELGPFLFSSPPASQSVTFAFLSPMFQRPFFCLYNLFPELMAAHLVHLYYPQNFLNEFSLIIWEKKKKKQGWGLSFMSEQWVKSLTIYWDEEQVNESKVGRWATGIKNFVLNI